MVTTRDSLGGVRSEVYQAVVKQANLRALSQYVLRPYPGRILYITAQGRDVSSIQDTRPVWQEYAIEGMEVYSLPAENSGLMLTDPHVQVLAKYLTAHLTLQTDRTAVAAPTQPTESQTPR